MIDEQTIKLPATKLSIVCKVKTISPLVTGEGKYGPYTIQRILVLINQGGRYLNELQFSLWNADENSLSVGDTVKADISIEARQSKTKEEFYNNAITCYGFRKLEE